MPTSRSWIDEIHNSGFDSQAILAYDGAGPYLIENNELQASSENIMIGGSDPTGPAFIPSDIVIRRNHIIKPLRWKSNDPSYDGRRWVIKALIEVKFGKRILIEGNILENSWMWPAFVVDSAGPVTISLEDITFQHNRILRSTCPWQSWASAVPIRRLAILHNLSDSAIDPGLGGNAYTTGSVGNFAASKERPIEDLWMEHNTVAGGKRGITIGLRAVLPRLTIRNNIIPYGPAVEGRWVWKDPGSPDPYWAVKSAAPDRDIKRNVLIGPGGTGGRVHYDDVEFEVLAAPAAGVNPDGSLTDTSPLRKRAVDGTDLGVDFVTLGARLPPGATP